MDIIEEFVKYSKYLKNKLEETNDSKVSFRYKSTIITINILKKNINLINNLEKLIKLKGIGKGTIDKIKEINEHGCIKEITNFVVEINHIDTLVKVIGIGPKKAKQLVNDYKIETIDKLIEASEKGSIKLTKANKIGIKYYSDLQKKIPRNEVTKLFNIVKKTILNIDPYFILEVCGSYRRELNESGDIDILITHKNENNKNEGSVYLKNIINELKK